MTTGRQPPLTPPARPAPPVRPTVPNVVALPAATDAVGFTGVDQLLQVVAAVAAGREPWASAGAESCRRPTGCSTSSEAIRTLRITNPDAPFIDDAQAAYTLALPVITGDERYGRHAAAIVDAWVTTTRQTATPARSAANTRRR